MKQIVFILILTSLCLSGISQVNITGSVTDITNEKPLIGAAVIGEIDFTVTDDQGEFMLKVPQIPAKVEVSFVGYQKTIIEFTSEKMTVRLKASPLQLNDILISGTSGRSIRNTPTSIQLISPEMLQRDAPFSFTQSINRVPGVFMHSGAINTSRITIRGIGSRTLYGTNKIKAYLGEIPLTDGSGNSAIEDIDQSLISRIQVIKGPNSSIYGAGLGGAISMQPLTSTANGGEISQTFGSFGQRRTTFRANYAGDQTTLTASYNHYESEGYRDNSHYNRRQANVFGKVKLSAKSSLSLLVLFTDLKAYIPSSIGASDFAEEPTKAAFTWGQSKGYEAYQKSMTGLSYKQVFDNDWELTATLFHQYRDAYEPRPFNILEERSNTIGSRNLMNRSWSNHQLTIGTELFHEQYTWATFENNYSATSNGSVQGEALSDNQEQRQYANFFGEWNWSIRPDFSLTVGLNANVTSYNYQDQFDEDSIDLSGEYSFAPVISPKIGVVYEVNNANTLFGNISHGFSPPSLEETLTPEGQINPSIKPESGWNFETGLRGTYPHFNYDVTTYYMHISNLLVAQRTAQDQYVGVNAGINRHFGVDLLTNYYWSIGRYTLNAFSSLSWMNYHFGDFTNEGADYSGNQLTGVPQWKINPGIELLSESGWYGNVSMQYVGAIPMNDENSLYSNPYHLVNLKLGYLLKFKNWELNLYGGIQNLTDEHYASMLLINAVGFGGSEPRHYYPGDPRNYFGGMSVRYRL